MGSELPPIPITAVINPGMTQVVVTFDKALLPNPAPDTANWFIHWNDRLRSVTSGDVTGLTVTLNVVDAGADPSIDEVTFDPPPFDLQDLVTLDAVTAFSDFPLTM